MCEIILDQNMLMLKESEGAQYVVRISIYLVITFIEFMNVFQTDYLGSVETPTGYLSFCTGFLNSLVNFNLGMWLACGISGLFVIIFLKRKESDG